MSDQQGQEKLKKALDKIEELDVDELSDTDLEDAAGGVDGSSGTLCCSLLACEDEALSA